VIGYLTIFNSLGSGSRRQGDLHQITSHENVTMGLENEFSCPVWAFAS
jgi:hypothetical protein